MPRVEIRCRVNPRARALARREAAKFVRTLIRAIVAEMKRVLSVPFPPASRPGEAPHLRTGTLRDSVRGEFDAGRGEGRVHVDAPYAGYLERGTKRMKRRPFALSTARRVIERLCRGLFTSTRTVTED